MDQPFAQAIAAWADFYAYVGTAAATLLGLLFVAVSLRTGIFRAAEVADVRDEAVYTFGTFLALMLVAGVFLVPDQRPAGVAVPLALLGALGLAGLGRVFRQWRRLNPGTALASVWKVLRLVDDAERRAAEEEEAARVAEARARAEAEQAALEQLKEENPEAYERPERPDEDEAETAEESE